ncbi:hypothetical protein GCM10010302_67070 [Streptomyces polychromogenes]|uniref:Uncharacterized protein n=1 Tax=Streptomyces polychromogenes TaxID=67342 RepID=A0ABN0VVW0_9ACTN
MAVATAVMSAVRGPRPRLLLEVRIPLSSSKAVPVVRRGPAARTRLGEAPRGPEVASVAPSL